MANEDLKALINQYQDSMLNIINQKQLINSLSQENFPQAENQLITSSSQENQDPAPNNSNSQQLKSPDKTNQTQPINITQMVCLPGQSPEACAAEYASNVWDEFLRFNQGVGFLKILVFITAGSLPIDNVRVTISKNLGDNIHIFYTGFTDFTGIIDGLYLPAPFADLSNAPSSQQPFTEYVVTVENPDYQIRTSLTTLIFDGIKSVQTVDLVSLGQKANNIKPDIIAE